MAIQLIQQAVCYMEEHIYEDIGYAEVARSVHMSSYNFHRTFSFIVGMTPNEYIRSRRLTLAAQELQTTDISVIDAAYKYGYESPESFSKAFSRFHGSTPKQAKQKGARLHLFNLLVIKIKVEGGSIMDYRMEHRGSQKFIALVRAFSNETSLDDNGQSIPDFWAECDEKNLIEPMKQLRTAGKKDLYGLCSPAKKDETHFNYGIGVAVDADTDMTGVERLISSGNSAGELNIPCGRQDRLIMRFSNVLVPTVTVWARHGISFSKNLLRRQVICRQMIQTMRFILKRAKVVCFASYGFLCRRVDLFELLGI